MGSSGESGKLSGAFQTILVGVVVALVAGGSAPWWWSKMFPTPPVTEASKPGLPPQAPQPHASRPFMSPFEEGINHPRGDLAGTGTESDSKQECATRCLRDGECKAMTFVHHPDGVGGICWLKGTINSATPHPDMVSAVKMYP